MSTVGISLATPGTGPAEQLSHYSTMREVLQREPTHIEVELLQSVWSLLGPQTFAKKYLRSFTTATMQWLPPAVPIGDGLGVVLQMAGGTASLNDLAVGMAAHGVRPAAVMDVLFCGGLSLAESQTQLQSLVEISGHRSSCLGLPHIGSDVHVNPSYLEQSIIDVAQLTVVPWEGEPPALRAQEGARMVLLSVPRRAKCTNLVECVLQLRPLAQAMVICPEGNLGVGLALVTAAAGGGAVVEMTAASSLSEMPVVDPHCLRVVAVVDPAQVGAVLDLAARWEVTAEDIGRCIAEAKIEFRWDGEQVASLDPQLLLDAQAVHEPPMHRPAWLDALTARRAEALPRDLPLTDQILQVVGSPSCAAVREVSSQYDHYAQGNTLMDASQDAGAVRVGPASPVRLAAAVRANPRGGGLDPYVGTQNCLANAYRAVAATGAQPVAAATSLSCGSTHNPEVMWQTTQSLTGLSDGCQTLALPVVSDHMALDVGSAEYPKLSAVSVSVVGVTEHPPVRQGFVHPGDAIVVLGETAEHLSGTAWAEAVHHHIGGTPPPVDFDLERRLAEVLQEAASEEWLISARALGEGGLAVALIDAALDQGQGFAITIEGDPVVALFSESAGRALVSLSGEHLERLEQLCATAGIRLTRLGEVTGEEACHFVGHERIALGALREARAGAVL